MIAFAVAAAVAAAMIALGFHYFTDAVAGAAVGTGTVLATALLLDLLMLAWRRSREPPPLAVGAKDRSTQVSTRKSSLGTRLTLKRQPLGRAP